MTSRRALVRRSLPLLAGAVVVGLVASDWPGDWPFWAEHPQVAGIAGGLALLLVAGAVVDSYLRRREARRWVGVGRAAAIEFAVFFEVNRWVMPQLLGADFWVRVWPDVEVHLTPSRERAAALVPVRLAADDMVRLFMTDEGWAEYDAWIRRRLPVLAPDNPWRVSTFVALHTLNRMHAAMIAQWTSLFAVLGDDARFEHVSQTVEIMDRIVAMTERSWQIDVAVNSPALSGTDAGLPRLVDEYVGHWVALTRAYADEHAYWAAQVAAEAQIPIPPRVWARRDR